MEYDLVLLDSMLSRVGACQLRLDRLRVEVGVLIVLLRLSEDERWVAVGGIGVGSIGAVLGMSVGA